MLTRFLCLSTILIAMSSGCEATEPDVALESTTLTAPQQSDAVDQLAHDPAFVAYAELAISIHAQTTRVVAPMTPAARDTATADALEILADAKVAGATPATVMPQVTALTTVTASQLVELRVRALALQAQYPNLYNTGPALFGQAMYANLDLRSAIEVSGGFGTPDPNDELADCLGDCLDEYTSAHNTNIAIFAIEQAICTGLVVWPPASIVCFAESLARTTIAELTATSNYDDCQDDCRGEEPEGECESDNDCANNEWCDTGTLGLGDNVCKADKSIGQVCSRDEKCLSGCCKFDFFQHPVSLTCNPAGDCN